MAYTTIDDPTLNFRMKMFSGTGSAHAETFDETDTSMQPDMVWLKNRSTTGNQGIWDSIRGATKQIYPSATYAEGTAANSMTAFNSNGFSVGTDGDQNGSGNNIAAWAWKAGGASAASNSNGSITSSVSANTTSGFSIVTWTGSGANATIGHGLGVVPKMIIVKNRTDSVDWQVYHQGIGNDGALFLNATNAEDTGSFYWNDTTPTTSVFSVGTYNGTNGSSDNMVAYCFADVKGYAKAGSYVGTGADVFIHTGFNVGWLLVKNASATNGWLLIDVKRSADNPQGKYLYANAATTEGTVSYGEFFSNGFGWKNTSSVAVNQSGNTFIYYAIAESPFVNSNGVPTNGR